MPFSPRKRRFIVAGLARDVGLKIQNTMESSIGENIPLHGKQGPSDESFTCIKQFFFRPDIVYTAPGMRDELTVWKNGKKN